MSPETISRQTLSDHMLTKGTPPLDMLVRTSAVERLSDFWSSCAQLRSQLTFLAIKYPLSVGLTTDDEGQEYLMVTVTVMLPGVKGKALISFLLDKDTYTRWPMSVHGLKSHVEVAYGPVK